MNYYVLENFDHDPEIAKALGQMVAAWAFADTMLLSVIARICDISLNMAMSGYHSIPTFEARNNFIRAIAKEWNTDEFDKNDIITALDKLAKLAGTRNRYVHGDWCADKNKNETVIFNHRASLASAERRKPVKAHDIRLHAETVVSRAKALGALVRWKELKA